MGENNNNSRGAQVLAVVNKLHGAARVENANKSFLHTHSWSPDGDVRRHQINDFHIFTFGLLWEFACRVKRFSGRCEPVVRSSILNICEVVGVSPPIDLPAPVSAL
ncbi:hypothetical protein RRG08_021789 [Elysia crispata]|uniref:Uncharacterized protein n=1 Tax=Elysia crispata TaxID=231223 RepID=A0AAE0ZYL5_9GAST|nr:hypothetical protein RRG08_021789 [Elysia crispata]